VKKQTESSRDKRQRILLAISVFLREHGYSPSLREICDMAEISSTSVAVWHLERLQDAGLVQYEAGKPRTIRLTHKA
jgi:SOS-response transcriptional repressor LexA